MAKPIVLEDLKRAAKAVHLECPAPVADDLEAKFNWAIQKINILQGEINAARALIRAQDEAIEKAGVKL